MKYLVILILVAVATISCHKNAVQPTPPAKQKLNVLILGNSITYSPANASIGWNGNWGMAASAADSDYVHLLTAHFKSVDTSYAVTAVNIAAFESNFGVYDLDANLKTYRDLKPQFIIVRIGENVTTTDSVLFEKKYADLLSYFKANNPGVKIVAAGAVWPERDLANKVMSKYSDYITLISLEDDLSNFAFGLFADPGIQSHPDNKGMKSISDQIWIAIQNYKAYHENSPG